MTHEVVKVFLTNEAGGLGYSQPLVFVAPKRAEVLGNGWLVVVTSDEEGAETLMWPERRVHEVQRFMREERDIMTWEEEDAMWEDAMREDSALDLDPELDMEDG